MLSEFKSAIAKFWMLEKLILSVLKSISIFVFRPAVPVVIFD